MSKFDQIVVFTPVICQDYLVTNSCYLFSLCVFPLPFLNSFFLSSWIFDFIKNPFCSFFLEFVLFENFLHSFFLVFFYILFLISFLKVSLIYFLFFVFKSWVYFFYFLFSVWIHPLFSFSWIPSGFVCLFLSLFHSISLFLGFFLLLFSTFLEFVFFIFCFLCFLNSFLLYTAFN